MNESHFLDEPCTPTCTDDCPLRVVIERRNKQRVGYWSELVLGRDAGGMRHFVDGRPIHCGNGLELQATLYKSDDYGEYTVPVQRGVRVRYEASTCRVDDVPALAVRLYHVVEGHQFSARHEQWMRFRWPKETR
jgi:hypothetical protein